MGHLPRDHKQERAISLLNFLAEGLPRLGERVDVV